MRLASAGGALALVLGLRAILPEAERAHGAYVLVTTVGYGHLLGASLPRRAPTRRAGLASARHDGAERVLAGLLAATSLAVVYALYTTLLAAAPWLLWPMGAVSLWHIVENDLALARAGADRTLPLPHALGPHLAALALTGGVAGVVVAIGVGGAGIALWEVFAAVTGFHLIEWLLVVGRRVRQDARAGRGQEARAVLRRTLLVHLAPALVSALAFAGGGAFASLEAVFAPPGYLLFSLLHVVHTLVRRRREAPRDRAPES